MKKILLLISLFFIGIIVYSQPDTPETKVRGDLKVYGKTKLETVPSGSGTDSILVLDPSTKQIKLRDPALVGGGPVDATDINFNGNREIKKIPVITDNLGTTTIDGWLNTWYYDVPTITLRANGYTSRTIEVGDTLWTEIISTTTKNGTDSLYDGNISRTSPGAVTVLSSFDTLSADTIYISYHPKQTPVSTYTEHEYRFQSSQFHTGGGGGKESSNTVYLYAYYPVFEGISTIDYTSASGTTLYSSALTQLSPTAQKTLTLTFNGTGNMYIIVPASWGDINTVKTSTGTVISGYTKTSVTSTSVLLYNNYTDVPYDCWISPTSGTYTGETYIITFLAP